MSNFKGPEVVVNLSSKELYIKLSDLNNEQSQNIKSIVQELNQNNYNEGKMHTKVYRPWGYYTSIIKEIYYRCIR